VDLLEAITGQKVLGFRAPDFSILADSREWAHDIISRQGLLYDSSIFPARTSRYGIADSPRHAHRLPNGLIELPLSTMEMFGRRWPVAGGGYLRLYPLALTKWAIRRFERAGQPAVVYLHPYEIDPTELNEIEWSVPAKLKLTQGLNRRRVQPRLENLLRTFRFGPVCEVLQLATLH
jgi:polysaccharide deacetylase family protein (PEP-CTERM system associated)